MFPHGLKNTLSDGVTIKTELIDCGSENGGGGNDENGSASPSPRSTNRRFTSGIVLRSASAAAASSAALVAASSSSSSSSTIEMMLQKPPIHSLLRSNEDMMTMNDIERATTTTMSSILESPSSGSGVVGGSSSSSNSKKRKYQRQYNESYLKWGFTCVANEGIIRPQCVLCYEMLANESMKPSKLARHMQAKHSEHFGKPVEFFEELKQKMIAANGNGIGQVPPHYNHNLRHSCAHKAIPLALNRSLKASYMVAMQIAKSRQPPSIGEDLLMPATMNIVVELLGSKSASKLQTVPMSAYAIKRHIVDLSNDIESQLLERLRDGCDFAIQLDEYTECAAYTELLVYVRVPWNEGTSEIGEIREDLLFTQPLNARATGEEIFLAINNYFLENSLSWDRCVGISSDCEAPITGLQNGAITLLMGAAPRARWTHCFLHRQALVSEEMSSELNLVLNQVMAIVNYMKTKHSNDPLFSVLSDEFVGDDEPHVLVRCDTRWLSRGKILDKVYGLRSELRSFLADKDNEMAFHFDDFSWVAKLAYLADIFGEVDKLTNPNQVSDRNVIEVDTRISAFKIKLIRWKQRFEKGETSMFPLFAQFVSSAAVDVTNLGDSCTIIVQHLECLQERFSSWFPDMNIIGDEWVKEPFLYITTHGGGGQLPLDLENDLISVTCDTTMKMYFMWHNLEAFWLHVQIKHSELAKKALAHLLPFPTSHFCESSFAAVVRLKNEHCRKTDLEPELRLILSNIKPRWEQVIVAAASSLKTDQTHLLESEQQLQILEK